MVRILIIIRVRVVFWVLVHHIYAHWTIIFHRYSKIDTYNGRSYDRKLYFFQQQICIFDTVWIWTYLQESKPHFSRIFLDAILSYIGDST